jgi:hypothetical protein
MTTCKSCGAPILFANTPRGRVTPLNADSDPAGTWELVEMDGKTWAVKAHDGAPVKYVSHFATCPNAHGHRRPKP